MASRKPKAELVAICKLEFYRKQKSWRYCPPERKGKDSKRRPKTTNAKLNQTYSIPKAPEKQEPSSEIQDTEERHILDEAFVDTETGTESDDLVQREQQVRDTLETRADKPSTSPDPPGSRYSPKWSIQRWAQRRHLWNPEPTPTSDPTGPPRDPTCLTHDPNYPTYASTCPALDPICPTQDPTFPQQTTPMEDANCPIFDNNYNKIQQGVYYSSHYLNLHQKAPVYEENYPTQSHDRKHAQEPFDPNYGVNMVYYNSNMCHDEFNVRQSGANLDMRQTREWQVDYGRCAGEGAACADPDLLGGAAAGAAAGSAGVGAGGEDAADGAWQPRELSDVSACDSLPSVASSDFLRGAALAPHSTQLDLTEVVGGEPAAARLPAAALAAAVARHAAALRALLAEAQRRQQMDKGAPQPLPDLYSFDEIPVRDPGGLHPPFNDQILASSRPAPALQGHTGNVGHTETQGYVGYTDTQGHVGHSGNLGNTESANTEELETRGRAVEQERQEVPVEPAPYFPVPVPNPEPVDRPAATTRSGRVYRQSLATFGCN